LNGLSDFYYVPPGDGDPRDMSHPYADGTRPGRHARATGPRPDGPAFVNGWPSPGNPPANGSAANGRPASWYAPVNGSGIPSYAPYPRVNGRPGSRYPPPDDQALPPYTPLIRRPDPVPPPFADAFDGRSDPRAPGYAPPRRRPAPGYPPPGDPARVDPARVNPAPGDPPPLVGRHIAAWLPFGSRLVLLPKDLAVDGQELREHRDVSGGWLRPAVFGAMDGLVTNSSLIAGIGGGGGGHGAIVLTGIAGLVAGAFSMATGEYISVTSQNELTGAEVELERRQHRRDPAGKRRRLTQLFIDKGVSPNLAEAVVRQISADEDRAVATHVREELGIDPDDLPSPRTAAAASFTAFTAGALIPLAPFLIGLPNLKVALALAGLAAIVGGAAVAKLTGRSMLVGGLRQFTAAFLATGMAFVVGHAIGGRIG
jgi:VIT1/CCC1 family predicted Fe2+/Mn2+ transporter